jgi:hypothetical protein
MLPYKIYDQKIKPETDLERSFKVHTNRLYLTGAACIKNCGKSKMADFCIVKKLQRHL